MERLVANDGHASRLPCGPPRRYTLPTNQSEPSPWSKDGAGRPSAPSDDLAVPASSTEPGTRGHFARPPEGAPEDEPAATSQGAPSCGSWAPPTWSFAPAPRPKTSVGTFVVIGLLAFQCLLLLVIILFAVPLWGFLGVGAWRPTTRR